MSRLPSSRGSSASSASSRSSGSTVAARRPGVLVQSPKSDIYVVMLGIALGAIILGCLLMTLVFSRYNFNTKAVTVSTPAPAAAIA